MANVKVLDGTLGSGTFLVKVTFFKPLRSDDPTVSPVVLIRPGRKTTTSTIAGRPTNSTVVKAYARRISVSELVMTSLSIRNDVDGGESLECLFAASWSFSRLKPLDLHHIDAPLLISSL